METTIENQTTTMVAETTPDSSQLGMSGYDPKNRIVIAVGDITGYVVVKPYTGYRAEYASRMAAEQDFIFQCDCSQN